MSNAGSCDRNFLAGQGIVHSNRKIASQLCPVLMAIGPRAKLKGDRTGAEVGYVDLRRWFFCYTRMSRGSAFQQFSHALGIGASLLRKTIAKRFPKLTYPKNICEERRRQNNKPDFGNRPDSSPNAAVGFNRFRR